jgi:hypothetical protein
VVWSATANANLPKQLSQQHQQRVAASSSAAPAGGGRSGGSSSASSSRSASAIPTGSTKLQLEVATNLPPGFGTAIDWRTPLLPSNCSSSSSSGGGGGGGHQQQRQQAPVGSCVRWRGHTAVLISALQKSVRRGLAASATR